MHDNITLIIVKEWIMPNATPTPSLFKYDYDNKVKHHFKGQI